MIFTEAEMDDLWHDYKPMSCREYTRHVEAKLLAKLAQGVDMPKAVAYEVHAAMREPRLSYSKGGIKSLLVKLYTADQMQAYGAACRLKALEDCLNEIEGWANDQFELKTAIRALRGEA